MNSLCCCDFFSSTYAYLLHICYIYICKQCLKRKTTLTLCIFKLFPKWPGALTNPFLYPRAHRTNDPLLLLLPGKASSLGINTWPNDGNGWKNSTFYTNLLQPLRCLSSLLDGLWRCSMSVFLSVTVLWVSLWYPAQISVSGNHRRRLFVGVVNPCKLLVGPGEGLVSFAVAF